MTDANPINIKRIDHVVLRVNDLDAMIEFYCDVLGCRLERGPGDAEFAQLRAGDSMIDLIDANGPLGKQGGRSPDHGAPTTDHICLLVQPWDSEAIVRRLVVNGIEPGDVASRYGATGMGPSIYFNDPEGNTIELKGA